MKPSWDRLQDDSMQWLCQDSDGHWWFTTHEPRKGEFVWVGLHDSMWVYGGSDDAAENWQSSKEPRP